MKLLEEKIRECGEVRSGNVLKVDNFLNHRLDVEFLTEVGREFERIFKETKPDMVMTLEASGIAVAVLAASALNVPVLFAKKTESLNLDLDCYTSEVYSYTRQKSYKIKVSKKYLPAGTRVLIIDDFLARGSAVAGMLDLCRQAEAEICGVGIVVEKCFQDGGKELRAEGVNLHSLAMIQSMDPETGVVFEENPDHKQH